MQKKREISLDLISLSALSIEEQQQQQQQREEEEEEEEEETSKLGSFPPPTLGFPRPRQSAENESEECSFGWYSFWQRRQRSRFENTPLFFRRETGEIVIVISLVLLVLLLK